MARSNSPSIVLLDVQHLHPHPRNPRTTFDEGKLAELAESIRRVGVLVPLLVSPMPSVEGGYVVLAGHRRLKAAIASEVFKVPCIVKDAGEAEQFEAMMVEQLQRADWSALDEAAAYRDLLGVAEYDVKTLAERIGKSESYVFQRLKLLDLSLYARSAMQQAPERITPSHGVLIARLDEKSQAEAVDALDRAPMSTRELEAWLEARGQRPKAEKPKPEQGRKEPEASTPVDEPAAPAQAVRTERPVAPAQEPSTPEPVVQKSKDLAEQFEEDVDRIGAEMDARDASIEDAFHRGVDWALSEISWHPYGDTKFYDDACEILGVDVADLPICRAKAWRDPGDDSVGIEASSGVGLDDDQNGTLLAALLDAALHYRSRARDLDELLKLHEAKGTDESKAGGEPEIGSPPIDDGSAAPDRADTETPSSTPSHDPPALEVVEGGKPSASANPLFTCTRIPGDLKKYGRLYDRFDFVRASDGKVARQYLQADFVPDEASPDYKTLLSDTFAKIRNWETEE